MENFKVLCTKSASTFYTKGKIYEVKNGKLHSNIGVTKKNVASVEAINKRYRSKFKLYEEPSQESDKQFTKADLRTGDWCISRDGTISQVFINDDFKLLILDSGAIKMEYVAENLKSDSTNICDIVKVIRPYKPHHFCRANYILGKLMYEYQEFVKLSKLEAENELTKLRGKKVKITEENI